MSKKNCKLVDHEDNRCISCTECLYKVDKKNRPWIYEESLNSGFFNREEVEVTVEYEKEVKNNQRTLDGLF